MMTIKLCGCVRKGLLGAQMEGDLAYVDIFFRFLEGQLTVPCAEKDDLPTCSYFPHFESES